MAVHNEITSLWSCEVRRKSLYAYKNVAAVQNSIYSFEMALALISVSEESLEL